MGRMEDKDLAKRVLERDKRRCRWCGRTNAHLDVHHIRYRRGHVDDAEWNLITLCREHHNYVHGLAKNSPPKKVCQVVLWELVDMPGVTGASLLRRKVRKGDFDALGYPT